MLSCPAPRKPRCARGDEWDRSKLALFVQAVVVNVARDEWIDKRIDRFARAHATPDFGGGNGEGGVVSEDDVGVFRSPVVGCLVTRQHHEACKLKQPLRIFPA